MGAWARVYVCRDVEQAVKCDKMFLGRRLGVVLTQLCWYWVMFLKQRYKFYW